MTPRRLRADLLTWDGSMAGISAARELHSVAEQLSLPVASLGRSVFQPRSEVLFDAEFDALVASIDDRGVLVPVLVRRRTDGELELLAGERRLEAAKRVGLTEIPARVLVDLSDADARAVALVDNLARADLSVWDEAQAFAQLREARRESGEDTDVRAIGAAAGKGKTYAAERLRIVDRLGPDVVDRAYAQVVGPGLPLQDLSKSLLLKAASAHDAEERASRLARALRRLPSCPVAPDVVRVQGTIASALTIKVTRPIATLPADAASVLLALLTSVLPVLQERVAELAASAHGEEHTH